MFSTPSTHLYRATCCHRRTRDLRTALLAYASDHFTSSLRDVVSRDSQPDTFQRYIRLAKLARQTRMQLDTDSACPKLWIRVAFAHESIVPFSMASGDVVLLWNSYLSQGYTRMQPVSIYARPSTENDAHSKVGGAQMIPFTPFAPRSQDYITANAHL